MMKYDGVDQIAHRERWALLYGPILMALVGDVVTEVLLRRSVAATDLLACLEPVNDQPLHFSGPLDRHTWVPYFEIDDELFTTVPLLRATRAWR